MGKKSCKEKLREWWSHAVCRLRRVVSITFAMKGCAEGNIAADFQRNNELERKKIELY